MVDFIAVDRYDACGPPTDCDGPREGTGVVPVAAPPGDPRQAFAPLRAKNRWTNNDERREDSLLQEAWKTAEATNPSPDGWHFVPCPRCGGKPKKED